MKNILKYKYLIALLLLVAVACEDKDAVRFPDLQEGVNARVALDPDRAFFDFGDVANASIAFDVHSKNKNIDEIVYTVTYTDVSDATAEFADAELVVPGSAFSNGRAHIELTSAQVAQMFNLPGGVSYIGGGDNLTFVAEARLTDGRVINAVNSAPSITGGTNASFTTQFNVLFACAFVQADAIGTYTITNDAFEVISPTGDTQVEVIAGANENQIILKDALDYTQQFDIVININPANGAATVANQQAWDTAPWGLTFGIASVQGNGFVLSCAGSISLNLTHSVTAGTFAGVHKLELQKN